MRVRWTKLALWHIELIQDYVAQDSPMAARRLVIDLAERAERSLSVTPEMGRLGRARGTRELVFGNLPYIVVYRLTDAVEILAVVHAARKWPNPSAKQFADVIVLAKHPGHSSTALMALASKNAPPERFPAEGRRR